MTDEQARVLALTPDEQQRLSEIASHNGMETQQLLRKAVLSVLEEEEAFRASIGRSIEQADRGELLEGDEVLDWVSDQESISNDINRDRIAVVFTRPAWNDLKKISYRIERHANLDTAAWVCWALYDAVRVLRYRWASGAPGAEIGTRHFALSPLPYIAVYRVREETCQILGIRHSEPTEHETPEVRE